MLATGLLSSTRDSKRRWDIDSLARECGKRHPDCIPVSASASSKGEETSREMQTLINFLIKQLEPLANEDKDEHIRLLEAKLAEKEKPASSSGLPVAQPVKRRRIAIKSDLTKHLFDMSIGVTERPLALRPPPVIRPPTSRSGGHPLKSRTWRVYNQYKAALIQFLRA